MSVEPIVLAYVIPMIAVWGVYLGVRARKDRRSRRALEDAVAAGLTEPPSLHPVIDPGRCIGCGSCVKACPEGDVLGIIDGRAALVEPTDCIGHGACRAACPRGAITLVFGTATRGLEIPLTGPDFSTSVPGIYIAGELGGMGLIRNAIEQGRQAMEAIAAGISGHDDECLDVVIVGAGPAGFAAALAAHEKRLRYVTVEQESFGGTVAHFPRGKIVMTAPVRLPLVGEMAFREVGKEELLAFWGKALRRYPLAIRYGERLEGVTRSAGALEVATTGGRYRARAVLLAIGRRGTPRRLDVPGEEQSKVVYRLIDPEQYRGKAVLVVGGGDSALESAGVLGEQPGCSVTLSYRSARFSRAKQKNRRRIEEGIAAGRIDVKLESRIVRIGSGDVEIEQRGRHMVMPNEAVIVCAGGVLPTPLLKCIGVAVETKYGAP